MAKLRLLDKARAIKKFRRPTWFDKQPIAMQKELLELREDWRKGNLPNANKSTLADMLVENGIDVNRWVLTRWLDEKNSG